MRLVQTTTKTLSNRSNMDDTCPMPLKTRIPPIKSLATLAEEALVAAGKEVLDLPQKANPETINAAVELHYWPYKN